MTRPCPAPRSPWLVAAVACLLFLAPRLPGAEPPRARFSLAAGDAADTLRQLARQAPESVVFPPDLIRGVPTPALQGEFTTREAAERLIAGTSLYVSQDPQSGALLIGRRAGSPDPTSVSLPAPMMPPSKPFAGLAALFALVTGPSVLAQGSPSSPATVSPGSDEVFLLTPFAVEGARDRGYTATSTLAGTRIKTELKDLGAAISVVTAEFLADTAATDAGTLLSYLTSSEVGGPQGNFSGAESGDANRYLQTDARTNPQFNQRIRGIGEAALTRGYFRTDIPFDSYNTDSVTVSRGPNSLLFGIGSPGGIINNGLKVPVFGRDHLEVTGRYGSHGSSRIETDLNRELIRGRVALRLATLFDDEHYQQKPAFERDKRLYGAIEVVLARNARSPVLGPTLLKANVETGRVNGSPVEIIPPSRAYDNWFAPFPAGIARLTGTPPPTTVVSPAEGGSWRFQATFNPFVSNLESDINTNVHPAYFRRIPVIYNSATASQPTLGLAGPDPHGQVPDLRVIAGMLGAANWNPTRDFVATAGLTGLPGVQPLVAAAGGNPATARLGTHQLYHANSPYGEGYTPGFATPTLQNRKVFDYHNLVYSGGVDRVEKVFGARSVALEQTFLRNRLGVELAYDRQNYQWTQDFLFSGGGGTSSAGPYDVYIDINEYLLNGLPNPNLGRAYTRVSGNVIRRVRWDRETARATVFGEYNFREKKGGWWRHLGKHRVVGLFSRDVFDDFREGLVDTWTSNTENIAGIANDNLLTGIRRRLNVGVYTSSSLLGVRSPDDIRLEQIRIRRPQPGDTFEILYADVGAATAAGRRVQSGPMTLARVLSEQRVLQQRLSSQAVSWQSYLWDEHLVGLLGTRRDQTRSYDNQNAQQLGFSTTLPDGTWNTAATRLTTAPVFAESGTTVTSSLIARFPERYLFPLPLGADLQFHYAKSENFNPIGLRNDTLGSPIAQPTGKTREYGFLVELLDRRISLRFNRFETALRNVDAGAFADVGGFFVANMNKYLQARRDGFPFAQHRVLVGIEPWPSTITTYDQFFAAFTETVPAQLRGALNPVYRDNNGDGVADQLVVNSITNQGDTSDRVARGLEVELTANLTRNWRALLNVGRQETVQSNTAPLNWPIAEAFLKGMQEKGILPLVLDPGGAGGGVVRSIGSQWLQTSMGSIRAARSRDGVRANEQREWRLNAVSKYTFGEGSLKGIGIGGAARWESKAATGYQTYLIDGNVPVPDVRRPFFDDGLFSADAFASYERRLFGRYQWRIQFNVRNLVAETSDIPVKTNPDGQVAVIRIPNPRVWYLTSSIRY
ncbi:MAG: hypothetical protein FJ381_02555 [Verrucomicrobia bacterium]|nr:hypothetical protein [Verrucomicrobiota bacterium]MBM3864766.1 hypothetical protein [Verrucomicrobiota bacterium]